jgi:hypothetical protein
MEHGDYENELNDEAKYELDAIMAKVRADYNLSSSTNPERLLEVARHILLDKLIMLVATDMATPADRNTLRQLLKDNGMILGDPLSDPSKETARTASQPAKSALPEFTTPEWHN